MLNDNPQFNPGIELPSVHWLSLEYSIHWGSPFALDHFSDDDVDQLLMRVDAPTCFASYADLGRYAAHSTPLNADGDVDLLNRVEGPAALSPLRLR